MIFPSSWNSLANQLNFSFLLTPFEKLSAGHQLKTSKSTPKTLKERVFPPPGWCSGGEKHPTSCSNFFVEKKCLSIVHERSIANKPDFHTHHKILTDPFPKAGCLSRVDHFSGVSPLVGYVNPVPGAYQYCLFVGCLTVEQCHRHLQSVSANISKPTLHWTHHGAEKRGPFLRGCLGCYDKRINHVF